MNIAVCFKVTPDLEKVVDSDWQDYNPSTDLRYAGRVLNCFDESALEIALRLKEESIAAGIPCTCTAITLGEAPPASLWQTLYATGYDDIRVLESPWSEFTPDELAATLAENLGTFDLIFTGRQAPMGDTASIPYLLSERLHMPVIPEVETVEALSEDAISLICAVDWGRMRMDVRLPAIVAVGNSPVAALRAATLRAKLQASNIEMHCSPVDIEPPQTPPLLRTENSAKACVFWPEEDPVILGQRLEAYLKGGDAS